MAKSLQHGFWASPISAEMVANASVRLGQTTLKNGVAYWCEGRPEESGRTVVVEKTNAAPRDLFPAPYDARSRVHEYGGGAYCIGGGYCWFVNAKDQAIYRVPDSGGDPLRIAHRSAWRFADLHWDGRLNRILAVAEIHYSNDSERSIDNCIVAVDVVTGEIKTLHEGADFYAYPRLSPNGEQLSWMSWQNPNMPWDKCSLWLADVGPQGELAAPMLLDQNAAIFQPEWTPDGELQWCADHDNWWNLYNRTGQLSFEQAECGLPLWNFAMSSWGHVAAANGDYSVGLFLADGSTELRKIQAGKTRRYDLPFSVLEQLRVEDTQALLIAGAADQPSQVIRVDLLSGEWQSLRQATELTVASDYLSRPRPISFDTDNAEQAHGLFYPPNNPDYLDSDGLPPLIVRCHGGPTSATTSAMEMKYQFWTSRGFAVLDVNYRGSSGYGRAYRQSLYGEWGIKDVADAVNGARYLAEQGWVNGSQLFISGSSAGGFTVLSALTFYDVFSAGASYYGIGDLRAIMDDTHKFEARYGDQLIGPYASHADEYLKRSPLFSAERLNCPVIFFQGLEDKIVPPNQAQMMVDALNKKGIVNEHYEFAGEGHGFRQQQTLITTLEKELAFYQRVLAEGSSRGE